MKRFSKNEIFEVCFSFVSLLGGQGGRDVEKRPQGSRGESLLLLSLKQMAPQSLGHDL